jgi:hypothetical protein
MFNFQSVFGLIVTAGIISFGLSRLSYSAIIVLLQLFARDMLLPAAHSSLYPSLRH